MRKYFGIKMTKGFKFAAYLCEENPNSYETFVLRSLYVAGFCAYFSCPDVAHRADDDYRLSPWW